MPRLFFADQPEPGPSGQPPHAPPPSYGQPPSAGQQPTGQQPAGQQQPFGQPLGQQPGQPPWLNQDARRTMRQRPARQRPTRPPGRELRQRAIASLVLGLLSLVALFGLGTDLSRGVWLLVFSAVIGAGASVIGITAVVKARRTGTFRPGGAIAGIVLGALAALVSGPILATYLAFPTPVNNYVKCLSHAQTSAQQHACVTRFYRSIHPGSTGAPAVPERTIATRR